MITLTSPLNIHSNITLKNRVVVPPMASMTADSKGFVTSSTTENYKRLASSKAALVMVEYTYVHNSGKSEGNQLGIPSDKHTQKLSELAKAIKDFGGISAIQLTHAGAKSSRLQTGGKLISPSGIPVPVKGKTLETPDVASVNDIKMIQNSFLNRAIRAYKAGFDVIELHAAYGYGLNQWLSPITNQRKDKYGGNIENQSRLLSEIIKIIKKSLPEIALSVRVPGMDHHGGGLTHRDSTFLAQHLEKWGVNIINVSSGIGDWKRPKIRNGEGYLVDDANVIQNKVTAPVIRVGGFKSANFINNSLQQKRISLAAVGRSILTNPEWGPSVGLT